MASIAPWMNWTTSLNWAWHSSAPVCSGVVTLIHLMCVTLMYFRHQTTIHDFQMVNITANTLCTRENPLNMKEGNPWFGYVGRLTSSLRSLSSCSRSFLLDTMHTFLLYTLHTFLLDTMYTFLLDSASEFSIIVNRSFAVRGLCSGYWLCKGRSELAGPMGS